MNSRQNGIKDKLKDRRRKRIRGTSSSVTSETDSTDPSEMADSSSIEAVVLTILQNDAIREKLKSEKMALLALAGGNNEGIAEMLQDYDKEFGQEDTKLEPEEVDSHSMQVALKMAEQRLEREIRKDKEQAEQLNAASLKQVIVERWFNVFNSVSHSTI